MISIVIPAYNEEGRIERTLEAYVSQFKGPYELIVALNGCTDNTLGVVTDFSKKHATAPIRILEYKDAIGKGGALRKGFSEAKGEYIGFVDADLATPVKDFDMLCVYLREHSTVSGAIASRLKKGAVVHDRGIIRTVVSHVFAGLVRFITDLEYFDTQCGAKVFTKKALNQILPDLTASDMTIDVDLLLAAKKHDLQIEEIPTEWFDRSSSALLGSPLGLFSNGIKMFKSLLKLKRNYHIV